MRTSLVVAFAALAASTLAFGCSSSADEELVPVDDGSSDAEESELIKKTVMVDADDKGKSVAVPLGQKVTIKLAQNPTTGFRWQVKDDGGLGDPTRRDVTPNPQKIGSGGHVLLTWSVGQKAGPHKIELELRRSFENGPPAEKFDVTLDVKSPLSGKCGGLAGLRCTGGEFCDFSTSVCGRFDQMGACKTKPQVCAAVFKPVCGCNGRTFSNACMAHAGGVDVASDGPCGN
jgi:predicted secreted protein